MVVCLAGDTVFLFLVCAILHPVVTLTARATGVILHCAFEGDVVPVVAFHAADWFLLWFGDPDSLLTDEKAC